MELLVESERRNALEEGFEDGIEQNKTEAVRNMLKENIDIDLISKVTNLTNEEIMKIKGAL